MAPANRARPSSQPRPVFDRVQSRQNRNAVRPFQTLIEQFYIQDGKELKWIMQYMKQEKGIDLSVKQYKSQLKTWGLRHKLTRKDAAFILRLLNQARREGRPEVVVFSGQIRRREDIVKYVQRNEKLVDEDHLLSCISENDETPAFIQLQAAPSELERPLTPPALLTPPSASPSSTANSDITGREISPMKVPIPSPLYTPWSSGEWLPTNRSVSFGAGFEGEVVTQNSGHSDAQPHPDLLYAHASETPAVVDRLNDLDFDIYRSVVGQIHSRQLHDRGSPLANFVSLFFHP